MAEETVSAGQQNIPCFSWIEPGCPGEFQGLAIQKTIERQIFRFDQDGGDTQGRLWTELDYPVFNLLFDTQDRLWATTAGGPLLQLDPGTGDVLASFGDGLTMALAEEPGTGSVGSN